MVAAQRKEALRDTDQWLCERCPLSCLIAAADVIACQYEWLKKGKQRVPFYAKLPNDRPLLLAGLWECTYLEKSHSSRSPSSPSSSQVQPSSPSKSSKSQRSTPKSPDTPDTQASESSPNKATSDTPTYTFTIITTSSNAQLSFLHDRMPVILDAEKDVEDWLDPKVPWSAALGKLLTPYGGTLSCYQVPQEVGKVGTQDPSFVQPVKERKDGIVAMFKKQRELQAGAADERSNQTSPAKRKREDEGENHGSQKESGDGVQMYTADDGLLETSETHAPLPATRTSSGETTNKPSAKPKSETSKSKPSSSSPKKKSKPNPKPPLTDQKEKITDFFKR